MMQTAFTAWILFFGYGLTLVKSANSELSTTVRDIHQACPAEISTSAILPQLTVDIESDYLNLSGIVQLGPVTTVTVSCPTSSRVQNQPTALRYEQSSQLISWSNQSFNRSKYPISEGTAAFTHLVEPTLSPTLTVSSLVFDNRPTPSVPVTSSSNGTILTGIGPYTTHADLKIWLLFGILHIAMV